MALGAPQRRVKLPFFPLLPTRSFRYLSDGISQRAMSGIEFQGLQGGAGKFFGRRADCEECTGFVQSSRTYNSLAVVFSCSSMSGCREST